MVRLLPLQQACGLHPAYLVCERGLIRLVIRCILPNFVFAHEPFGIIDNAVGNLVMRGVEFNGKCLNKLVKAQHERKEVGDLRCPQCDLTWTEFRQRGLLGCPNDYLAFEEPLKMLIVRAHGTPSQHVGKVPRRAQQSFGQQVQLLRLRQDLQQAVETENYESAAQIRDKISKVMPN